MRETKFVEQEPRPQETIEVASDFKDEKGEPYKLEIDKNSPAAFYFDVDGTLVDLKQYHHDALLEGFVKYFPQFEEIKNSFEQKKEFDNKHFENFGVAFGELYKSFCAHYKLDANAADYNDIEKEYSRIFLGTIENLPPAEIEERTLKGAVLLLENLKRNHWPAAVVTANDEPRALATLKKFNLGKYFVTGGFNNDVPREIEQGVQGRTYILRGARRKLKEKFGKLLPADDLGFVDAPGVVFGDTPKDFLATTPYAEKTDYSVLVGTGGRSVEVLDKVSKGDLKPDLVLPELHLTGDKEKDLETIKRLKLTNYNP